MRKERRKRTVELKITIPLVKHLSYYMMKGFSLLGNEFFESDEEKLDFFNHLDNCKDCQYKMLNLDVREELIDFYLLMENIGFENSEVMRHLIEHLDESIKLEYNEEEVKFCLDILYPSFKKFIGEITDETVRVSGLESLEKYIQEFRSNYL